MENIKIGEYGRRNHYRKAIYIDIGELTLYFSYDTCVAFHTPETGIICSQNVWSTTTGRHLNDIIEKSERIPNNEFEKRLNNLIKKYNLAML